MYKKIKRVKSKNKRSHKAFAWSLSKRGAQARARFCRKMAEEL